MTPIDKDVVLTGDSLRRKNVIYGKMHTFEYYLENGFSTALVITADTPTRARHPAREPVDVCGQRVLNF